VLNENEWLYIAKTCIQNIKQEEAIGKIMEIGNRKNQSIVPLVQFV
jgi:hypothetical protein